jgi:MFS family permease
MSGSGFLFGLALAPLFLVPVAALIWRIIVTKSRTKWLRVGAAGAAMLTLMGAFMISGQLTSLRLSDWRAVAALVASATGSTYLLLWSQRKHGNRRRRTISIMAAVIGLVPVIGALLGALINSGEL